ncbi:MAG TPA: S1C family serine protease [Vicinamibacterales bacterium]|jgi:S1-C subfamily serine protease|nr:S1C family serine protease [Vicinamibacterales bacterium]
MSNTFSQVSDQLADAVGAASQFVVQVHSGRRPAAAIVFDTDLVMAPARAVGDDVAVVRKPDGQTVEGHVLGSASSHGIAVIRVAGLGGSAARPAAEPRVGALAVAVGRTWSGGVMALVTNVAVVGGPLRTGRASSIERVIRVGMAPHAAITGGALVDGSGGWLGLVTGAAIRGTAVVLPASIAVAAARQIVERGGERQGFLGISTLPVAIPERQRGGASVRHGLLITGITSGSPAEAAGLLVGDVITAFADQQISDAETLLTLLRGDHVGKSVTLTLARGTDRQEVAVMVGERSSRRG